MNSISRAVSSKFSELSNKRQRLPGEKSNNEEFVNPTWTEFDATTSNFNFFEPPTLDIPEPSLKEESVEQAHTTSHSPSQRSPNNVITKKMSQVVRKLSPFGTNHNINNNTTSKDKELSPNLPEVMMEDAKKVRKFKDTRERMEKIKKSIKSKDREQLIESDSEQE